MRRIWSPEDVEKLRAALAYHPASLGHAVEPDSAAERDSGGTVIDMEIYRERRRKMAAQTDLRSGLT